MDILHDDEFDISVEHRVPMDDQTRLRKSWAQALLMKSLKLEAALTGIRVAIHEIDHAAFMTARATMDMCDADFRRHCKATLPRLAKNLAVKARQNHTGF